MALSIEDELAIQGLAARYNFAIDEGDGDAFAAAFTESGVLDAGGMVLEGRTALKEFAQGFPDSIRSPRHVSTNLVMDGDGNHATLRAYLQISMYSGEPAQPTILSVGTYDDVLSKEDGTWRFERRTFTPDS
jgi:uncharacterized protein (TIGR02246 family)